LQDRSGLTPLDYAKKIRAEPLVQLLYSRTLSV